MLRRPSTIATALVASFLLVSCSSSPSSPASTNARAATRAISGAQGFLANTSATGGVIYFPTADFGLPRPTEVPVSGIPSSCWAPQGASYYEKDHALVACFGSNQVLVVRASTASVEDVIDTTGTFDGMGTIAVAPGLEYALAASGTTLAVIHAPFTSTSSVRTVALPSGVAGYQGEAIVFDPAGNAYIRTDSHIAVLPPPYSSVAFSFPAPGSGWGGAIGITPDGNQLLATDLFTSTLYVFTAPFTSDSTPVVLTVPGAYLDGIAVSPDGKDTIVADVSDSAAWVIHAPFGASSEIEPLAIPSGVGSFEDVAISADGKLAMLAGNDDGGSPLIAIAAPFTASAPVYSIAVTGGRGAGSFRFMPPGLAPGGTIAASAPEAVQSGASFTVTLTYGNSGSGASTASVISAAIPAGTSFVSASEGGTHSGSTITWSVGSIPAGASGLTVSYVLRATAPAGSTITVAGESIQNDGGGLVFATPETVSVSSEPAGFTLVFRTDGTPGATITGDTEQTVEEDGSTTPVTAVAPAGYNFSGWTGSGEFEATAENPLTVDSVDSDLTLTAHFVTVGSLTLASGGGAATTAGTGYEDQVCVMVRDTNGNPLAGATVHFSVPESGASASVSATVTSDEEGLACTSVTANTVAGHFGISAWSGELSASSIATLTNVPAAPAHWSYAEGSVAEQSTTVGQSFPHALAVRIADAYGNAVPEVAVQFAHHADGGTGYETTLSASTAWTDESGIASITASANHTVGWESFDVSFAEVSPALAFWLAATPGAPATLTIDALSSPQAATVGGSAFPHPLGVTVTDQWGNAVPEVLVSFSVPPGSASLSSETATTDETGHAAITAATSSVARRYDATIGVGDLTTDIALANTVGAPGALLLVSGDSQETGVDGGFASPLTVKVVDGYSNPVPGTLVSFQLSHSAASATLSSQAVASDADGLASVTATPDTVAGAFQVIASTEGVAEPVTFDLRLDPGVPATLTARPLAATQSAQVATAFQNALSVLVQDSHGNPVPEVEVTFTAPGSGASSDLSAGMATTDGSGLAGVNATANTVSGSYPVSAAVGELNPAVFSLTNLPGAPNVLAATGGTPQQAVVGTDYAALSLVLRDEYGNPVPGVVVTFSAPSSGPAAVLGAATATTADDGTAQVAARASTASGPFVVLATAQDVAAPVQFALTNLPGVPSVVSVAAGSQGQSARVGDAFASPLTVTVLDSHGNPVPGVTVAFACPAASPNCSLDSTSTVSDGDGKATVHATAGSHPGSYDATARVEDVAPVAFQLANLVGLPDSLASTSGASQQAGVLTAYPEPLGIVVHDAFGNVVPDVPVAFRVESAGPQSVALSAAGVTTDASGAASVTATANGSKGAVTVQASAPGVAAPVLFDLTNSSIVTTLSLDIQLPVFGTVIAGDGISHLRAAVGPNAGEAPPTGTVTFVASRSLELVPGQSGVRQDGDAIVATLSNGTVDVEVKVLGWRSRTLQASYTPDDAAALTWNPVSKTVELVADEPQQEHGAAGGCSTGGNGAVPLAALPLLLMALFLRRRRLAAALVKRLLPAVMLVAMLSPGLARAQLTLGLRMGYALGEGGVVKGVRMADGIKSQIPIQLDAGYRFSSLEVGAFGSYGQARVGSICQGSCSGSVVRVGVAAAWHFPDALRLSPWAGAGMGYEWARYKATAGGDTLQVTLHGMEFLQLQGGADYRIGSSFTLGPFAAVSFGQYSRLDVKSPYGDSSGSTPSRSIHSWLSFGLKGTCSL